MFFVLCPLLGTQLSFGQEGKITDTQTLSGVKRFVKLCRHFVWGTYNGLIVGNACLSPCSLQRLICKDGSENSIVERRAIYKWERKKISNHRGVIFTILRFIFSQLLGLSFHNNGNFLFMQTIGFIFCGKDIDALGSGTRWQWVTGVIGARPPQ